MKKKTIIFIHLLFWFYLINQSLFPMYVGTIHDASLPDGYYLHEIIVSTILNAIGFYIVYFAFPGMLALRPRLLMFPLTALVLFIILFIRLPLGRIYWIHLAHMPPEKILFQWMWVWNELRLVVITGIYAVLIRFMIQSLEARKVRDTLINQRQAGELALLKAQVNPHFLFNTLNSIYSLVYQKSEEAPEAVMKFSSIMRYVLYEAREEMVPLEKEIDYLKSYVELQKLRIRRTDYILLTIEGDTEGKFIAPMLLIPFVENAFKHGSRNHQPGIRINLRCKQDELRFDVCNYIKEAAAGMNESKGSGPDTSAVTAAGAERGAGSGPGAEIGMGNCRGPVPDTSAGSTTGADQTIVNSRGISPGTGKGNGQTNIRRRLELMYPERYQLDVRLKDDQYFVTLIIKS